MSKQEADWHAHDAASRARAAAEKGDDTLSTKALLDITSPMPLACGWICHPATEGTYIVLDEIRERFTKESGPDHPQSLSKKYSPQRLQAMENCLVVLCLADHCRVQKLAPYYGALDDLLDEANRIIDGEPPASRRQLSDHMARQLALIASLRTEEEPLHEEEKKS